MSDPNKKPNQRNFFSKTSLFVLGLFTVSILVYFLIQDHFSSEYKGVPSRAISAYKEGVAALDSNNIEKALNLFYKAIELDDTFADALARIAESYFRAAMKHRYQKNTKLMETTLAESLTYLSRALSIDSKNGIALFVAGLHAHAKDSLDEAITDFELAESNGAHIFELHTMLGYLYNEKGLTAKSIQQYELAYELKRSDQKTLFNLGELYFGIGQYPKAIFYYAELLKFYPDEIEYKVKYAAALWRNENVNQAKSLLNQILESPNYRYQNYNTVAWALIDQDLDLDWGIKLAHVSNEMKPNNLQSIDILGWGYFKKKDYASAVKYLNMSMNIQPSEEVRRRLNMAKEKLDESVKK